MHCRISQSSYKSACTRVLKLRCFREVPNFSWKSRIWGEGEQFSSSTTRKFDFSQALCSYPGPRNKWNKERNILRKRTLLLTCWFKMDQMRRHFWESFRTDRSVSAFPRGAVLTLCMYAFIYVIWDRRWLAKVFKTQNKLKLQDFGKTM